MEELRVADAISEVFTLFRRCNKYIDETEPWVLAKDEAGKDRLSEVMYNLTDSIVTGACLLKPFMPETAERILRQLNTEERSYEDLNRLGLYPGGNKVTEKPEILFARLDLNEILTRVEAIREAQRAEYAKENGLDGENPDSEESEDVVDIDIKPEIEYEDFAKLQLRIGKIIKCEEVPKSKKLLCSQVKIGSEVKQILSGIKQYYSAEEMVGKKVLVLSNLKPATLAGMVSEGMLLCAEDDKGNVVLLSPEKDMPAGCEVC